jgi:hypothetical protein
MKESGKKRFFLLLTRNCKFQLAKGIMSVEMCFVCSESLLNTDQRTHTHMIFFLSQLRHDIVPSLIYSHEISHRKLPLAYAAKKNVKKKYCCRSDTKQLFVITEDISTSSHYQSISPDVFGDSTISGFKIEQRMIKDLFFSPFLLPFYSI